jgi:hypothetical protein
LVPIPGIPGAWVRPDLLPPDDDVLVTVGPPSPALLAFACELGELMGEMLLDGKLTAPRG